MKKMHFRWTASLALVMLLVLVSASTGIGAAQAAGDPKVKSIDVKAESFIVEQQASIHVEAHVYVETDSGALEEDTSVVPVWSVDKPELVSVTVSKDDPQRAVVTGLAPGDAISITASVGDVTGTCANKIEVSGLRLDKTELNLFVNQGDTLQCSRYGSVRNIDPVWSSDNISVAEVKGGKVIAHYPGTAVITAKAGKYAVECKVTVKEDIADAIPGTLDEHRVCKMSVFQSKLDEYSHSRAKGPLELITGLTVAPNQGVLYRGYMSPEIQGHGVGSGENYYVTPGVGQSAISDVTFVPNPGFSGIAVISYTGRSTAGIPFHGTIRVEVKPLDDVIYRTTRGRPVSFEVEDFQAICRARTGRSARYLSFEPPTSDKGGLFRNYAISGEYAQRVTKDMKLSTANAEDELLSFVPSKNFTGTVIVPYHCEDSSGNTYAGKVTVIVQNSDGSGAASDGRITYNAAPGGTVRFQEGDFDAACRAATGEALDSVRFVLSTMNTGKLLYDGREVTSDTTIYYVTGSNRFLLKNLSYQAPADKGTYYVDYMGLSVKNQMFSGRVAITVEGNSVSVSTTVSYQGSSLPISLRTMDFQMACLAATQDKLDAVRFRSLPDRSVGVLYLDEKKPIDQLETYSADEGMLDRISFVAKAGYQGTVDIPYEGINRSGGHFYGSITLKIADQYCPTTFFDMNKGWGWARPSVEYLHEKGIVKGRQDTVYDPANSVSRGEFVVMVCRAFGFTASSSSNFADVPANKFYASAIAAAQERGILPGSGNRFYPEKPITRQDAAFILQGALRTVGQTPSSVDASILTRFADGGKVSDYAKQPMAALVQQGIFRGDDRGALRPASAISRAEIAVILHRALTL